MDNLSMNLSVTLMNRTDVDAIRYGSILSIYILPWIVFSGLMLNTISCLVFTSPELRHFSSSVYIFALLISDTGVLIGLLFIWLEAIGYSVNHLNGMCQGLVFFTYIFSFLSVWYVVCITVENYITNCHPTQFNVMCTRRRATIVVVCILLLSVLLYAVTAFAAEVTHHPYAAGTGRCSQRSDLVLLMHVLTYIDSVVTLLLPLISISGMLITVSLSIFHKSRWKRRLSSLPMIDLTQMRDGPEPRRSFGRSNAPMRVAKMLFALSLSYIIMNAPSHVTRLYYLIRPAQMEGNELTYWEGLIQLAFQYVSYTHHASKFWIFLTFSQNFMKGLKHVLSGVIRCRSICK